MTYEITLTLPLAEDLERYASVTVDPYTGTFKRAELPVADHNAYVLLQAGRRHEIVTAAQTTAEYINSR